MASKASRLVSVDYEVFGRVQGIKNGIRKVYLINYDLPRFRTLFALDHLINIFISNVKNIIELLQMTCECDCGHL